MFTLEIGGKAIAVVDADEARARAVFESDVFKQDLTVMTSQRTPLWDGTAPLNVRPASQQERAASETLGPDPDEFDDEEDDGLYVVFLVPIDHDHEDVSGVPPKLQS